MSLPSFAHLFRQFSAGVALLEGPDLRYGLLNAGMQAMVSEEAEGRRAAEQLGRLPVSLLDILAHVYASQAPYVAKACVCATWPEDHTG